jgi:GntR family transcriptional regulator
MRTRRRAELIGVLPERFGVPVAVADQWISAIRLTEGEARLLGVSAELPALLFQRVTRDPDGAVVEYSRSLYRGDRYQVHTRHRRAGQSPEPPRD